MSVSMSMSMSMPMSMYVYYVCIRRQVGRQVGIHTCMYVYTYTSRYR